MKWIRRLLLALVVGAALAAIVLGMRAKPLPVEVSQVARGPFVEVVEEPAKTRVRERFVVSSPVTGQLARIVRKPGDAVEAGEAVATVRPVAPAMQDARTKAELDARLRGAQAAALLAQAAVDKAKALQAFTKTELARIQGLADSGSIPARDREKAELDLLIAEKDVKSAELSARVAAFDLEVARAAVGAIGGVDGAGWIVRAPLKGRILRVLQTSEGVVTAGTPLLEVADPSDLEVVASLLTSDAIRIQPGARSTLERWGGDEVLDGRVRTIEPAGYTKISALGVEEQRVDVVIDLVSPQQKWANLGDGFRVVSKTVVHRLDDAVKASSAALFRDGDKWALFVVDQGHARKRSVDVTQRSGLEAIVAGIDPGTTVILFPSADLTDGAAVVVR
jgi:HlyD family secretion protein